MSERERGREREREREKERERERERAFKGWVLIAVTKLEGGKSPKSQSLLSAQT